MTAKERAEVLIDKFKDYVHGYVGSSMLSNHEYPEQILSQAKKCAVIACETAISALKQLPQDNMKVIFEIKHYEWTIAEIKKHG